MLAFHEMIAQPAIDAGIKVPENPREYDQEQYVYWHVYCMVQLGASLPYPSAHWDNAKVIASVPEDKILEVNYKQLVNEYGLNVGSSR